VRAGLGWKRASYVPHEVQTRVEKILHQLVRNLFGAHGPAVRADSAVLGGGERAGLHVAVRQSHVQDRLLRDGHEHVRQRVFPHRYERDALLVARLRAQGQAAAAALLPRAVHRRLHLDCRCVRRAAARGFLHDRERVQ